MANHSQTRAGAVSAIVGVILLFVGTYLHPMDADPKDSYAAFTEYAADRLWVGSHLTQLAGVILMVVALVTLSRELASGPCPGWAWLGAAGAVCSLTLAAALQAVDGVALKVMVDAWAAAPESQKASIFHAAFGVRQVEVGLASMMSLLFGATVTVYGIGIVADKSYPKWFGWLAILGGIPTAVAGVVMAYTGFSALTMAINMPASSTLLIWVLILGVLMWRRGGRANQTLCD